MTEMPPFWYLEKPRLGVLFTFVMAGAIGTAIEMVVHGFTTLGVVLLTFNACCAVRVYVSYRRACASHAELVEAQYAFFQTSADGRAWVFATSWSRWAANFTPRRARPPAS